LEGQVFALDRAVVELEQVVDADVEGIAAEGRLEVAPSLGFAREAEEVQPTPRERSLIVRRPEERALGERHALGVAMPVLGERAEALVDRAVRRREREHTALEIAELGLAIERPRERGQRGERAQIVRVHGERELELTARVGEFAVPEGEPREVD